MVKNKVLLPSRQNTAGALCHTVPVKPPGGQLTHISPRNGGWGLRYRSKKMARESEPGVCKKEAT